MPGQSNQPNKNLNQADGRFDKNQPDQLPKHVSAEDEVRENEDASLQDETYSFDEENTGNEEYHDASEIESSGEDDYLQ